jgi:hypothetical protein
MNVFWCVMKFASHGIIKCLVKCSCWLKICSVFCLIMIVPLFFVSLRLLRPNSYIQNVDSNILIIFVIQRTN